MTRLRAAHAVALLAIYSYLTTVASVAWYLRRADSTLAVGPSILHAAIAYMPWLVVGLALWAVLRLFEAGWKGIGILVAATTVIVPIVAAMEARIALALASDVGAVRPWATAMVDRLPITLLLYTAMAAAALAIAHGLRVQQAQKELATLNRALSAAKLTVTDPSRLLVSTGKTRVNVDTSEVEWFASAGNYVVVNWNGREGLIRETLQSLESRLDARLFARIHRSTLVNLARVKEVRPLSDGSWWLMTHSDAELTVSRSCRDGLLEKLGHTTRPSNTRA